MSWLPDKIVDRLRSVADAPSPEEGGYRLIERLGQGGMGIVWLAEDRRLDRKVALKLLDVPDSSGELERRLVREAKVLARLEHPGIVPVHDVGHFADGRVFYTMRFVQGTRLDKHLSTLHSPSDRLRLLIRACEAVAFAHAHGVLHRDLKPENIMVGRFGEVLVMDWGVARVLHHPGTSPVVQLGPAARGDITGRSESVETEHGAILGTPGYMSPEQAGGDTGSLDARADVYSLGMILRFLLKGNPISRPLEAIAAKATAPDASVRYSGASELALDVSRYLNGLSVSAYTERIHERAFRFVRRHALAVGLVLAYIVLRLLISIFFRA